MTLTIITYKNDKGEWIAKCEDLKLYSYGNTSENAVDRLKKIIIFYSQSIMKYEEGMKFDGEEIN